MNNMERASTRKRNTINSSVLKVLRQLSYYLNVTDPLIIPMIQIFLSCHEEAHDNKEFGQENSKPPHESQIMTC